MTFPTLLCGDYFINHEIRIPLLKNQDSMESIRGVFSWLKCFGVTTIAAEV